MAALLISYLAPLFAAGEMGDWETLTGYNVIGDRTYFTKYPQAGYNITPNNISSTLDQENDKVLTYWTSDPDEKDRYQVGVVRNNTDYRDWWVGIREKWEYEDFIWIYQDQGHWDRPLTAIPLTAFIEGVLLDDRENGTSQSLVEFSLSGHKLGLLLTVNDTVADISTLIYANTYNLKLIIPTFDEDAKVSMWTILGQMLTMRLPDVHPVVNVILSVVMWSLIGIAAFVVIERVLPG